MSTPKEIELPALDAEYQRDKPWEIAPGYDEPTQQLHCRERQLLATIAERDAALTREREKDEEIARLKSCEETYQLNLATLRWGGDRRAIAASLKNEDTKN